MSFYYTLILQEAEPSNAQLSWIWLKPSIGQAYIRISNEWVPLVGGEPVSSFVAGFYWREQIIQENNPVESAGTIWIKKSINQAYMFFQSMWIPFAGA